MLKGYKTVIFNIVAAIMPVLEASGADLGLTGQGLALYGLGITIGNIVLRYLTTTPIGKAE